LDKCNSISDAVHRLREIPVLELVVKGPHDLFRPAIDGDTVVEHPMKMFYQNQFTTTADALLILTVDETYYFAVSHLRQSLGLPRMPLIPPEIDRTLARKALHHIVFSRSRSVSLMY
jgi:hypothetical protein